MEKKKQLKVKLERRPLKEAPFTILPKAIFHLRKDSKARSSVFRLLIATCYFYSKSMTEDLEARITYSELMKILGCNSMNTITTILQFLEDSAIIVEKEYDSHNKYTTVTLSHPTILAERIQNATGIKVEENIIFKFPKILFLLPISPQAKSVLLYLYSKKNYPEDWEVPATSREIAANLKLKRKNTLDAIKELLETNLIKECSKKGKTPVFQLIPPISIDEEKSKPIWLWSEEIIQKAHANFPLHPFWKLYIENKLIKEIDNKHQINDISNLTNREPKPHQYGTDNNLTNGEPILHQYGTDKEGNLTNREPKPHQYGTDRIHEDLANQQKSPFPEDYIENELEDYIEDDDIYSDGGVTTKKKKPSKKEIKKKKQPPKKRIFQEQKVIERNTSPKNWKEIEEIVGCLKEKLPSYVLSGIKVPEGWLIALRKFYSEETAEILARMFVYLSNKTTSYSNINNPVGFLISFGDEGRIPDFKEFLQRFLIAAGYSYLYEKCLGRSLNSDSDLMTDTDYNLNDLEKSVSGALDKDTYCKPQKKSVGAEGESRTDKEEPAKKEKLRMVIFDTAKFAAIYFEEKKKSDKPGIKAFSDWLKSNSRRMGECPERIKSQLGRKFDDKLVCYLIPEEKLRNVKELYGSYWERVIVKTVELHTSE